MKKRIRPCYVLIGLMAIATPALSFEVEWMASVVEKQPCVESLGAVLSSPEKCWSWMRNETASPFFDVARNRILIGGTDAQLHVVDAATGATVQKVKLNGNLVSSVVLAKDKNFLLATDKGFAYLLDAATLEIRWNTQLEVGILETPYAFGDYLYLVSQMGTVYSIEQATGKVQWVKKRQLPNRIFLRHLSNTTIVDSEVNGIEQELLAIGNPDGNLEFLSVADGSVVESLPIGKTQDGFADVATKPVVHDGVVYVAGANFGLVAVDATTRVKKWTFDEVGITQITLASGVLVAAGAKFVVGVASETGKELWRFYFAKGAPSEVRVLKGEVFVGSDIDRLYVLDLFTGEKTQVPFGSGLGFSAPIENIGGDLLAMSSAGVLFKFKRSNRILNIGKKA